MIVRIFKTNQVYIYAFIPLVLLALRWPVLIGDPPFTPSGQLPFLSDFFAWLSLYPSLSLLLGIVALTFQAYILSETCNEHRLVQYSSNLSAFVLVLAYSIFAPQSWFSPVIFANIFGVLALKRILNIFHQGDINGNLFRIGIYVSLASILYLPSIFLLIVLFYDLAIVRSFHWREYLIPVIGLFTPFLYLHAYYFFWNKSEIFFNYFIEPKTFLSFLELELINWIPSIVMLMIAFLSMSYLFTSGRKRTVRENNLFKVVGFSFLLFLLLSMVYSKDLMSATALNWPSLTIILTYYFLGLSRNWIREGMVYALLITIIVRDILGALAH